MLLAGCGDDGADTADSTAATGTSDAPGTTAEGGSTGADADLVEVPPSPPLGEFDPYVQGTPVDVGQVADMGAIRVVVDGFTPGPATDAGVATVDVTMVVDNVVEAQVFLPDVYTVCAPDGRRGIATTQGDLEILTPLAAGEAVEGTLNVEGVDGCPDLLLQVLSQNETTATPPVAQYSVPADLTGG